MSSDISDQATDLEEKNREGAIQAELARLASLKAKAPQVSAEWCVVCDEPISTERRKASPGCQMCIDCARRNDARQRIFRR
ncbi:TraR/DksA C4-type zinc finger protein [Undibacterium sp. Di27W]|uniref:TraR/DksA C4-type zinc finger protein n=1 Tax=Undibacterium sp. Di27W TaxID=3413036 RepID=UPI003BF306C1